MGGRRYRAVKRFQPGDTVHMEDQDEAGRAMLEKAKPAVECVTSFNPEQHNAIAWALVRGKLAQGESPRETLAWAIRNGAQLPDDYESREWIAEALEGKHEPKRGRGRPQKQERFDLVRAAVERGIVETYEKWLTAFQRDPELAWLRYEALRLREEQPDAAVWRRRNDLGTEEGRRSFETALAALGASPFPRATRGKEAARELALKATAQERREVWKSQTDKRLTPAVVARIVTRTRNAIEEAIAKAYHRWLEAFKKDRELAWLRYEELRLRQEEPDAAVDLSARPCPPATQATPHELAQEATVRECEQRWLEGELTPSVVARIVTRTRAKKSE